MIKSFPAKYYKSFYNIVSGENVHYLIFFMGTQKCIS